MKQLCAVFATSLLAVGGCLAAEAQRGVASVAARHPQQVLWGDTHLHTSYSLDAFLRGNLTLTPEDAYRFARGEAVTADNGREASLNRPLDFLVVADHAEYLGLARALNEGEPEALALESGPRWRDALKEGGQARQELLMKFLYSMGMGKRIGDTSAVEVSAWQRTIDYAEAANQPGTFSAFAGFEWTSSLDANNLHRVVMFRDGAGKLKRVRPFTSLDSANPEDLWAYLANYEEITGGKVLAIPHNGNLSNGLMFTETTFTGEPIGRDYAERRVRWEPIIEVTQIKGDGETHPLLSPNDEFADYGTWDAGNFGGVAKEPWMLQYEYARSALRLGLKLGERTGVNPYRFGMIGATDAHSALPSVEEDNFWEAAGLGDPAKDEGSDGWERLAGGYTAVWATENTREAIFDAMARREVYATTGPRITVRFFGGWDFAEDEVLRPDYVRRGYGRGVPMGGELADRPKKAKAPVFLISALKDPAGANLDRVQVVKGWLDEEGETQEKVYDVAWSGKREARRDSRLPAVGKTVDLEEASYLNSIGAAQLATTWRDPDFDPAQRAFYYVRVLEIPTPRWIVYDEKRFGLRYPAEAEHVHQERAYTSPIWYNP